MKKSLATITIAATIAAILATGCGASDDAVSNARPTDSAEASPEQGATMTTTISGELAYRERIALIPGGTATISLLDTSLQDVSAVLIAETVIALDDQQIPIPFELVADTTGLDTRGTYSLQATITGPGGDLQWTTDTANVVDVLQAEVEFGTVMMVGAGATATDDSDADDAASTAPIVGDWNVTQVNGADAVVGSAARLVFGSDGTLGGNTGCNSFSATYAVDGATVAVASEIAMTLMACDGATGAQETAFLTVLRDLKSFEIDDDGVLTLASSDGAQIVAER